MNQECVQGKSVTAESGTKEDHKIGANITGPKVKMLLNVNVPKRMINIRFQRRTRIECTNASTNSCKKKMKSKRTSMKEAIVKQLLTTQRPSTSRLNAYNTNSQA